MSPRSALRTLVATVVTGLVAGLVALSPGVAHADPAAAPTAPTRYLSTPYGTPVTGNLCTGATDPQGDPIQLATVGTNAFTFEYDTGTCAFTASPNTLSGYQPVTYRLTDGTHVSDWLTLGITVGQQGNAPVVAQPDALTASKGVKLVMADVDVTLGGNDADPEAAPISVTSLLPEGPLLPGEVMDQTSWYAPRAWMYTPPTGYTGTRRFRYDVSDGTTVVRQAFTITVTDNGPPKAPVATPDGFVVAKNGSLAMTKPGVLGNDSDADSAYFTVNGYTQAAHGSLTGFKPNDGTWVYTPHAGYEGPDSFSYRLIDAEGNLSPYVTVNLTVKTLPPVAVNDTGLQVTRDTPLVIPFATLKANDSDPDSSFEIAGALPPLNGKVHADYAAKTMTYTPKVGWTGTEAFGYVLADPHGNLSNWANVAVTVVPPLVNTAPVAHDDTYEVHQGQTLTVPAAQGVFANDTDLQGDDLAIAFRGAPAHGTFTSFDTDTGAFTYVPDAGWHGTETVDYTAQDGKGGTSGDAQIVITVHNDAPVAVADGYQGVSGVPLVVPAAQGVLVNDTDPEDEALKASSWSIPQHAQLVYDADGSFTLTPDAGHVGTVTFWYTVRDEALQESNQATVTVTFTQAPPVTEEPPASTDPVGSQQAGVIEATTPRITGKARVGRRLRVAAGVWGPAPVVLTYQWFRNGKPIGRATTAVYRLKDRDRGKRVTVQVTGTRPAYDTVVRVSAARRVR